MGERLILDGEETSMAFCPPLPVGRANVVAAMIVAGGVGAYVWYYSSLLPSLLVAFVVFQIGCVFLRTRGHPRVFKVSQSDEITQSTACWRGYRGTWEIRDGHLYLVNLHGRYQLEGKDPLLADWFTGVLRVPQGEILEYVHMGFGSVYEEDLLIKIVRGKVETSKTIDNRGKEHDRDKLAWRNLPGRENRFPGDNEL